VDFYYKKSCYCKLAVGFSQQPVIPEPINKLKYTSQVFLSIAVGFSQRFEIIWQSGALAQLQNPGLKSVVLEDVSVRRLKPTVINKNAIPDHNAVKRVKP